MIEILYQLDEHLQFISSCQEANQLTFVLKRETKSASCPHCGHLSHSPHSTYIRTIHDLPVGDQSVILIIQLHKWFCNQTDCTTKIFTERVPWLSPYRRKTKRLEDTLLTIAFSMSCLQAEKVCQRLHMPTSHDSLLDLIKYTSVTEIADTSPFCGH